MPGLGTLINVATIVLGATIGVLIGNRLPERTTRVVTDGLGLITLVLGALNVASLSDKAFVAAAGPGGTFLVVIGSVLVGSIVGSLLGLERRLESFGAWLQAALARGGRTAPGLDTGARAITASARERFINGFVDASLLFAIGPLAILGAFSDGTGAGIEQLVLKATLDGFASIAFAASLGWGVAFSALPVALWQGGLTAVAFFAGSVMSDAAISALTATGGILLLGVGLRLLNLKHVAVGDMLPALVVAPLLITLLDVLG